MKTPRVTLDSNKSDKIVEKNTEMIEIIYLEEIALKFQNIGVNTKDIR